MIYKPKFAKIFTIIWDFISIDSKALTTNENTIILLNYLTKPKYHLYVDFKFK